MRGKSHTGDSWNSGFISRKNLNGLKVFFIVKLFIKARGWFKSEKFPGIFYTCVYFLFT
jgi:hypothetical protein